jgi:hypothetical protein
LETADHWVLPLSQEQAANPLLSVVMFAVAAGMVRLFLIQFSVNPSLRKAQRRRSAINLSRQSVSQIHFGADGVPGGGMSFTQFKLHFRAVGEVKRAELRCRASMGTQGCEQISAG